MQRRAFLAASAALSAAPLAAPRLARAQAARPLRFIPDADLAIADPVVTTAYQARDHGFLIYDTLYGQDASYRVRPQMVAGHVIENDGRLWKLTLREGLRFHDGERVLARDAAASVARWGRRDSFGQALMAAVDEIAAPDDRTLLFRLKEPFPLLPDALGHYSPSMCPIMPARVAATDAFGAAAEEAVELHGGIGFTWESDCQLFYRRARLLAAALGGRAVWATRLARAMVAARPGL